MDAVSDGRASNPLLRPSPPGPSNGGAEGLFGDGAARLAGLAGALLGWRADEFWSATPTELGAVLRVLAGGDAPAASSGDLERLMEMFPDG